MKSNPLHIMFEWKAQAGRDMRGAEDGDQGGLGEGREGNKGRGGGEQGEGDEGKGGVR